MQKNILKKIIYTYVFLSFSQTSFANEVINNFETSAKIENFCSIQANDVNFGVVALPLTAQSANAQMRVLCTNNTPYKVDLAYGQYIATEGNSSGYYLRYSGSSAQNTSYSISNSNNKSVGYILCGYSINYGKVAFSTIEAATIYGYTTYSNTMIWISDTKNTCTSDNTLTGTKPTGWVGPSNALGNQYVVPSKIAEFGSMSGTQKGDKLAYKVTLPNDSSKTWTKGLNSYSSTGIGTEQMITINAQIVPDKSSSKYVAQDVYLDNVTAEITY